MSQKENINAYYENLEKYINDSTKVLFDEGGSQSLVAKQWVEVQKAIEAITISNIEPKLKIEIRCQYKCNFCKLKKICVSLACYHNICKECYIAELEKYTDNCLIPICDIKCRKCPNVTIKYSEVSSICPLSSLEDKKKENAQKALLFKCPTCGKDHERKEGQYVELFCGHVFCMQSIKIPIMTKLFNLKKDDLFMKCPYCNIKDAVEGDKSIINKFIFLKYVVDEGAYEGIQKSYLNLYDNETDKKVSYSCIYCSKFFVIIPKTLSAIECKACNIKCCPFCGSKNIHEGLTCDQFKKTNKDQQVFEENRKKMGICICPHCKGTVKKISGCQYVYCPCGKQFCNLCERKLIEAYHHSHFYGHPYGDRCKGQKNELD